MPETIPPPQEHRTGPSLVGLLGGLGFFSAVFTFAAADEAPCEGWDVGTVGELVLPLLTAAFLAAALVVGTRRPGDRRRRKVVKVAASIVLGIIVGVVGLFVVVLLTVGKCLD